MTTATTLDLTQTVTAETVATQSHMHSCECQLGCRLKTWRLGRTQSWRATTSQRHRRRTETTSAHAPLFRLPAHLRCASGGRFLRSGMTTTKRKSASRGTSVLCLSHLTHVSMYVKRLSNDRWHPPCLLHQGRQVARVGWERGGQVQMGRR